MREPENIAPVRGVEWRERTYLNSSFVCPAGFGHGMLDGGGSVDSIGLASTCDHNDKRSATKGKLRAAVECHILSSVKADSLASSDDQSHHNNSAVRCVVLSGPDGVTCPLG